MFLVRCTFWLAVGFMVIKPFVLDPNTAVAIANSTLQSGKNIAIEQALQLDCNDATCTTIKTVAAVSALTSNQLSVPTLNNKIEEGGPTPPLRPDWAN
ncbi:hypothetical protein [Maritalea sp.]|uniref:hypothetical protein n=1 Tax=Maritalea sp. TaxID=2003361 RepID=UPI003EF2B0D0